MSLSSCTNITCPQWKGWVETPRLPHGRGTLNIIWSCLFTILICTWTIQHPMAPANEEWWLWVSVRKARMMAITALAPEMLVGTAIGEYLLARQSLETVKTGDWSITHGFFALMGGFEISDEHSKFPRVNVNGITMLVGDGFWERVPITEEEIRDKSKANALIKATAVLQSLWLVVQCCARAEQGLPITPLELATTAFVGCTLVTYLAWFS